MGRCSGRGFALGLLALAGELFGAYEPRFAGIGLVVSTVPASLAFDNESKPVVRFQEHHRLCLSHHHYRHGRWGRAAIRPISGIELPWAWAAGFVGGDLAHLARKYSRPAARGGVVELAPDDTKTADAARRFRNFN